MIAVPPYISPKDYLDLERQSPIRHEYRRGLVYAMAGGTDNHDRIAFNFLKIIDNHLGDLSDCRFYSGNVKVSYQDEFYYYPDAFVTCDPRDRADRYVKRFPKLRTYAANFLNAVYSVEIPPTPLDKGGGDSRGDLQRH